MTDIPGTGKLIIPKSPSETPVTPLTTLNINELKNPIEAKSGKASPYDTIYAFLLAGTVIGIVFFLISLKYPDFLIFVPLGPVATLSSWYVRKFLKKYEDKNLKETSNPRLFP